MIKISKADLEGHYSIVASDFSTTFTDVELERVMARLIIDDRRVVTVYGDVFKAVKEFWNKEKQDV